ncbi:hypothetical protein WICPIJ_005467 [Wickerhamomyces pijperi]|uniref:Uncharacterized protein n=1 Tax=Wickerhamomyces pijperi TaxID=599730 RepID=A0A9P8TMC4_WICPI|nr:hypothetical protein WICPIJ_005467 [Wickerhamomyces pijperi]
MFRGDFCEAVYAVESLALLTSNVLALISEFSLLSFAVAISLAKRLVFIRFETSFFSFGCVVDVLVTFEDLVLVFFWSLAQLDDNAGAIGVKKVCGV